MVNEEHEEWLRSQKKPRPYPLLRRIAAAQEDAPKEEVQAPVDDTDEFEDDE